MRKVVLAVSIIALASSASAGGLSGKYCDALDANRSFTFHGGLADYVGSGPQDGSFSAQYQLKGNVITITASHGTFTFIRSSGSIVKTDDSRKGLGGAKYPYNPC